MDIIVAQAGHDNGLGYGGRSSLMTAVQTMTVAVEVDDSGFDHGCSSGCGWQWLDHGGSHGGG